MITTDRYGVSEPLFQILYISAHFACNALVFSITPFKDYLNYFCV